MRNSNPPLTNDATQVFNASYTFQGDSENEKAGERTVLTTVALTLLQLYHGSLPNSNGNPKV